jgi:hypothetical protein
MIHLRTLTSGPHGAQSQKLLNEVAAARSCLVEPDRKRQYDQQLRARLPAAQPAQPQVVYQTVMVPVPVPSPYPAAAPPAPQLPPMPPPQAPEEPAPNPYSAPLVGSSRISSARRKRGSAAVGGIKLLVGAISGLAIGILAIWIVARSDPFGLFEPLPSSTIAKNEKKPKVVVSPPPTTSGQANGTASSVGPSKTITTPAPVSPSPPNGAGTAAPVSGDPVTNPPATTTQPPMPSPMPMPADVPLPNREPPVAANPSPPKTASNDTRRQPPTAEEQAAKLAEIKAHYKTEFDNGAKPAGREAFVAFLLDKVERLKSEDPVAQFVLLRQVYTLVMSDKDFIAAAEVVDRLERDFALDPYKLRLDVLTQAAAAAKLPADRLAVVSTCEELIGHATSQQRLDEADKLARLADAQARALNDAAIKSRIGAMKVDVEKLAGQWRAVEDARQTLATKPDDANAAFLVGRFVCTVQGDWATGLPLLAKGNNDPLSKAAQLDLAGPTDQVTARTIGDAWHDAASSGPDFTPFEVRARHWYRQAVTALEGFEKIKVEERIAAIDALKLPERPQVGAAAASAPQSLPPFFATFAKTPAFDPVDLLRFVNPQALQAGGWGRADDDEPGIFSRSSAAYSRVMAGVSVPREYQVRIEVRRPSRGRGQSSDGDVARGPLVVGLVGPKGPFVAVIDWPAPAPNYATFLNLRDAKELKDNPTARTQGSPLLPVPERFGFGFGGPPPRQTIVCQVRRRNVTVLVDGTEVCRLAGDLSRLSVPKEWAGGEGPALFLGSHQCHYDVAHWLLEPLPSEAPPAGFANP